jgi:hypothetical protein
MAMSRSFGGHVVHHPPADRDLAAGDVLEPCDHAEQRGFPAARGADQDNELAIPDLYIHPVQDLRAAEVFPDFT